MLGLEGDVPLEQQSYAIEWTDLEIKGLIGLGTFGRVMQGAYFGTDVAIKELANLDKEENRRQAMQEFLILQYALRVFLSLKHLSQEFSYFYYFSRLVRFVC